MPIQRQFPIGFWGGQLPQLITEDLSTDSGRWLDGSLLPASLTISSGKAIWTPSLGSELLTNWDFSSWSGDNPVGWTVAGESGGDPELTERNSGQGHADTKTTGGSANFYTSATNNQPVISQNSIFQQGRHYQISLIGSKGAGANSAAIEAMVPGGTWTWWYGGASLTMAGLSRTANANIKIYAGSAPRDITLDSISIKRITPETLFRVQPIYFPSSVQVSIRYSRENGVVGSEAGVVFFKDINNYIVAELSYLGSHPSLQYVHLYKMVAGTMTVVASSPSDTIAYSAGTPLKIVANADFDSFSVFYNDVLILDAQSIPDFSGMAGKWYAGIYNTYNSGDVTKDSFVNFEARSIFLASDAPAHLAGASVTETPGSLLESTTIMMEAMYEDSSNDIHVMLAYMTPDRFTVPGSLVDVNLTDGTHVVLEEPLGRPGPGASDMHPISGKIYVGLVDPSRIAIFNPLTSQIEKVLSTSTRDIYRITFADDGTVWWGGLSANVYSYNPTDDEFIEWGQITDDAAYAYYAVADSDNRYVYFALAYEPWRLAILDNSNGLKTIMFEEEGYTNAEVRRAVDGTCWFVGYKADSSIEYYSLVSGVVAQQVSAPAGRSENYNGFYKYPVDWEATFGYEIDLSQALPPTAGQDATFRYRLSGESWEEITLSGISTAPVVLRQAVQFDSSQFCVAPDEYFPVALYTPDTTTVNVQGWTTASLYRVLLPTTGDVYLVGYHDMFLRWDSGQPWSIYHNSTDLTATNPRSVAHGGKSHQFLAEAENGTLWSISQHVRSSDGCSIVKYDPDAGTSLEIRDDWGLANYYGLGIVAAGQYLVASLKHIDEVNCRMIVINPDDQTLVSDYVLSGVTDSGFLVPVSSKYVFAIARTEYYKFDIETGTRVYTRAPGGSIMTWANYDFWRGACMGPDGLVWVTIDSNLYAIQPDTGNKYIVVASLDVDVRGELVWLDNTPYLLGPHNLHKVNISL